MPRRVPALLCSVAVAATVFLGGTGSGAALLAHLTSGTMTTMIAGHASVAQSTPYANLATATVSGAPGTGTPTFFANVKMPCSQILSGANGCGQLLEPEVTSAPDGTVYVTAQEGVPGGVNIWRRDPGSDEFVQMHKPDANEPVTSSTGFALGGGDNDLAVTSDGRVIVASLSLLSAPVSYSTDRGETFTKNEFANGLVNVDRMWLTTVGKNTVYYAYHDNEASQIWLVKSTDGGVSFDAPRPVIPPEMLPQSTSLPELTTGNVQGDIVTDPQGRLIIPFLSPHDVAGNVTPMNKPDSLYVAVTNTNGENPVVHSVYQGTTDIMGLFPAVASDKAGILYATWTDKHGISLSISRDHGTTWSKPTTVSTGAGNKTTVFPYVIAGTRGRVALAWLGTSAATNDDINAKWYTYFAITTDALSAKPVWTQVIASDHAVHHSSICLNGLHCDLTGGNRSLAEVLQMGLTKDGRVIISYPDTSTAPAPISDLPLLNATPGWAFLAEQRFGPGLYANVTPTPPNPNPAKPKHGGLVTGLLKKLPPLKFFFVGGAQSGSTGLSDSDGNAIDAPGDTGMIARAAGTEGHVASANLWTTTFGGIPLAFETPPLTADTIIGGAFTFTTYLAEASGVLVNNNVTLKLLDIDPKPGSIPKEITEGASGYVAGVDATKGTYTFKIAKPWEVVKGHRIRGELSFACACSTTMRFYYGDAAHASGFTTDNFARVLVQGAKVTRKPAGRPVGANHLPATGVGTPWVAGILFLGAAAILGASLRRRRS